MLKKIKIDKKVKYLIASILLTIAFVVGSSFVTQEQILFYIVLGAEMMLFMVLIALLLMYDEVSPYTYLMIPLIHMVLGFLAFLYYFPNLGPLIKLVAFIGFGVLSYTIFLVNNVFLVTREKGSIIPLYTAALTWSQVLMIVISIPYYSGILKITIGPVVHGLLVLLSSFLFVIYSIWAVSFDPDIKKTVLTEKIVLASILSFIVFLAGLGTSFIPAESFLRALFLSAVLMFDLAYVVAHYKNRVYFRMFLEYGAIVCVLFFLIIIFNP